MLISSSTKVAKAYLLLALPLILVKTVTGAIIRKPSNTSLGFNGVECTKSVDWLGSEFDIESCNAVSQKLYNIEVLKHSFERFEFLGAKTKPVSDLKTMQTPRRYTVGTCTLVIAMMYVFRDGDLPNPPKGPFYDTDVASFRDLERYAGSIDIHCVVLQHSAGYRVAGQLGSIGVLIMSKESYENRIIPTGVSPAFSSIFGLPNLLNESDSTTAADLTA